MTVSSLSSTELQYTPSRDTTEPTVPPRPPRTEQRLLQALDSDGSGQVSKDEFRKAVVDLTGSSQKQLEEAVAARREAKWNRRLERRFDGADTNHDGSIDAGEMSNVLANAWRTPVRTDGRMSSRASVAEVAVRSYLASS